MRPEETEKRLIRLEERVQSMVDSLNAINKETATRVMALEKKFAKLAKASDPRATEKSIAEAVDKALAAFDKARKK